MRLIYVDEAGTSELEPVAVVVGIIVHADTQWMPAQQLMLSLLKSQVPEHLRPGFIFHAAEIRGGSGKYRDWSREGRFELLCDVLSIPRSLGLSIGFSACRKELGGDTPDAPISKSKTAHVVCFMNCMEAIDSFLKHREMPPREMAAVVAEEHSEMRKWLKFSVEEMKKGYLRKVGKSVDYRTPGEEPVTSPLEGFSRLTRFVDVTHFVGKSEAPLLGIADACAFALRRFFAGQQQGEEMLLAMLGTKEYVDNIRSFDTPCVNGVFPFIPPWLIAPDRSAGGLQIRYSVDI